MSNNCLVTKLKGDIQNDNLPILGKLIAGAESINQEVSWVLAAGQNAVTLNSSVPFSYKEVPGQTFTNAVVPAGKCWMGKYNGSSIGVDDLLEISSVYDIKALGLYFNYNAPIKYNLNSGINSLKYSSIEALAIDEQSMFDFPESLGNIQIQCPLGTGESIRDIESILMLPNIDEVGLFVNDVSFNARFDLTKNFNSSTARILNVRGVGPITNLPINIEFINIGTNTTGTIEDWVDYMRAAGRETGLITITGGPYNIGLTYTVNGSPKAIKNCIADEDIISVGATKVIYLSWDADTIAFISKPQDAPNWDTTYVWYTKKHPESV